MTIDDYISAHRLSPVEPSLVHPPVVPSTLASEFAPEDTLGCYTRPKDDRIYVVICRARNIFAARMPGVAVTRGAVGTDYSILSKPR